MKKDRTLLTAGIGCAVVLAVLVVVAAVVILLGAGGSAAQDDSPEITPVPLVVRFQPAEEITTPLIVDELEPQTLLVIEATGFERDTTGRVVQCVRDGQNCVNSLSVRFDDRGSSFFQYLVTDDVGDAPGFAGCRLAGDRCTIVLRVGDRTMEIDTVFVDAAPPPGMLTVSPRNGLLIGGTVTVTASEFSPGSTITAMICAAPSTSGSRCGAPGPEIPLTIGPDGTAETEMTLDATEVGADEVACGRRVLCRVVVTADEVGVRARPVTLSFADSAGADYDAARVGVGLVAAVALGLLGVWLFRSTDWNPPPEADSSAIDDADFADLDLEAELFGDPTPVAIK